ncbi:MAG: ribose 5-phosphate isomerase B [Candidatus Omnitrophica bacterium]|nr:ribose 5-phosphate isomerase B [Candidatus Omnitrophota bacterium]
MKIGIASDHAGFKLKKEIVARLKKEGYDVKDFGVFQSKRVDYPDYGEKVAQEVSVGHLQWGILICGTGIGMGIVANKFKDVRAAVCNDPCLAKIARSHNDANIICLGGRITGEEYAWESVKVFLETPFSGGRHYRRIGKIRKIEKICA